MEGETYKCQGCGSQIPASNIDFRTRSATCPWCGLKVIFPKKHSTASPNAQIALDEAMELFLMGNFDSAKKCAESVLSMVNRNAAASFIIDYYFAFIAPTKKSSVMLDFFKNELEDAEFDIEEEEMFKKLLLKTISHIGEYEEQILKKFSEYDSPKELADFVEVFSPLLILKRTSFNWLNKEMVEIYKAISRKVAIPKTWYALYSSILKNSESPFVGNNWYLKTKTERIYNEVVIPIGEIFSLISDETLKIKFSNAYTKAKMAYEKKMNE